MEDKPEVSSQRWENTLDIVCYFKKAFF